MLEYFKIVLLKVSFDQAIFEKELQKAIRQMIPQELKEFREWCYIKFGQHYPLILNKYLHDVTA